MTAPMVLIIYCCPFVLWAKPMHRIRMTAEMVAVVSVTYCGSRIHSIKVFTTVSFTLLSGLSR